MKTQDEVQELATAMIGELLTQALPEDREDMYRVLTLLLSMSLHAVAGITDIPHALEQIQVCGDSLVEQGIKLTFEPHGPAHTTVQ